MSVSLKLCILILSFTFKKLTMCWKIDAFALLFYLFVSSELYCSYFKLLRNDEKIKIWIISLLAMNASSVSFNWSSEAQLNFRFIQTTCGCRSANQRSSAKKIGSRVIVFYIKLIDCTQERVIDYFVQLLCIWIIVWSFTKKPKKQDRKCFWKFGVSLELFWNNRETNSKKLKRSQLLI